MDIKLLPIDDIEINLLKKWQNDNNIKYPLMGFRFPIQTKSVESWLEGLRENNGIKRIVYGIKSNDCSVGMISLHQIDYVNSKAMLGLYIAEKELQNIGLGTQAAILILDFAFNGMGLNRVGIEVLQSNKKAINLYKKIGFIKEGIQRSSFFHDGIFENVEIMSILRSEFQINKEIYKERLV